MHTSLPLVNRHRNDCTRRLMVDIAGTALSGEDREILSDPRVGGLILFTRNFQNREQLIALCQEVHQLNPAIKIAVDHEGGRVQRFRAGFSEIPPMRTLGALYQQSPTLARQASEQYARLMAKELREVGVDFTFAPVVDVDFGLSEVIGNRAFHRDPAILIDLVSAFSQGLHAENFPTIGKHYPGHGFVRADSHTDLPKDGRSFAEISANDLMPYLHHQKIVMDAVMTAHICYEKIDAAPASFSRFWLDYLRNDLGFTGLIFSDDLSMVGAHHVGSIVDRCRAALSAGCEVLLICNDRLALKQALSHLN